MGAPADSRVVTCASITYTRHVHIDRYAYLMRYNLATNCDVINQLGMICS